MLTAVNYGKIPSNLEYKNKLMSSTDHIRDTRRVTLLPSTGGGVYKPSAQNSFSVFLEDAAAGAFCKMNSVYATCKIKALDSAGAAVSTAKFCSSANDIIARVTVRSKRSRVVVSDIRNFNLLSAVVDKISMTDDERGSMGWARGMRKRAIPSSKDHNPGAAATVQTFSGDYGRHSSGAEVKDELNAGTQNFLIDLSKIPLFGKDNDLDMPLSSSGGLEIEFTLERASTAFIAYHAGNVSGSAPTTATDYLVTDFRLHATINYYSEPAVAAIEAQIKMPGGLAYPYKSVINTTHSPQSQNESVRLASSLEHLNAVFIVHRADVEVTDIKANSLGHFRTATLEEAQANSGGVLQPSIPLVCTTATGTKATADVLEELKHAAPSLGVEVAKGSSVFDQDRFNANTSAEGDAVVAGDGPKEGQLNGWEGTFMAAISMSSGFPFSSIYNRSNSSTQGMQSRKADLLMSLKYASDPSAFRTDFFLAHDNVLRIKRSGELMPEQISF